MRYHNIKNDLFLNAIIGLFRRNNKLCRMHHKSSKRRFEVLCLRMKFFNPIKVRLRGKGKRDERNISLLFVLVFDFSFFSSISSSFLDFISCDCY